MAWTDPTLDTIVDEVKALWKSYRTNAATNPFSDLWIYSNTAGHLFKMAHEHLTAIVRWLMPNTTTGTFLNDWLYFMGAPDGLGSYGKIKAHVSSGTDALAVTFTAAGAIATTDELTDTSGNRFHINENYNWPGPGGTTYNADVESIDTGLEVNAEIGDVLTFTSPPANVNADATLVADMDFGRALETDSEGVARLLSIAQNPSLSGNWAQWERWVEDSIPGNLDCYVFSGRQNSPFGVGTIDLGIVQRGEEGTDRVITSAQETVIDTYLDDNAPAQMYKQVRILDVDAANNKHYIALDYELAEGTPAAQQCDWDAQGNKRTVIAVNIGLKKVQASAVYAAGLIVSGDRVLIAGEEVVVDDGPGEGALNLDEISFTTWPWSVTLTNRGDATGYAICSGGGLIMTVYNAVRAYVDGLGPARDVYAAPISGWDDSLRIKFIQSAAVVAGLGWILDITATTIDAAAVDVNPSYDATSTIDLLIAPEIAVYQVDL
jgi:uncharacterized phage protein gp47/JayE